MIQKKNNSDNRNNGVTIAKALAIMLMVLGHSGCPEEMNHFLGIVRMPLFFLMSGYCFKTKYIEDGKKYLKRRVTGVYWPYVKWGMVFLLLHNVFCSIGLYNTVGFEGVPASHMYDISETLHRALTIVICMSPEEQLVGGFWFLHDLFWGSLLFYFSMKVFKKEYLSALLLFVAAFAFSYFDLKLSYFVYPRTLLASVFITVGYSYKKNGWSFEKSWLYIIPVTLMIGGISLFWYSNCLDMTWRDMPAFAVLAILGSLVLFGFGEHLDSMPSCWLKSTLIYIGGKTFNVLTWHMLSFKIVSLLLIIAFGLSWHEMAHFPIIEKYAAQGWFVVYFIIGLIVPVFFSLVYDKLKIKFCPKMNVSKILLLLTIMTSMFCSCAKDEDENVNLSNVFPYKNPAYPVDADSLRIMVLGNSFTESSTHYLGKMIKDAGLDTRKLCIYGISIGGSSFNTWLTKYTDQSVLQLNRCAGALQMTEKGTLNELLAQQWDVIVITQASHLSYNWSEFTEAPGYIEVLTKSCKNKQVCLVYQIPWSHIPQDMPWMLDGNIECAKQLNVQCGIDVFIPTGTAVQLARSTKLNDDKYLTSDNWHLNTGIGEYIASCTWFEKLISPVFKTDIMNSNIKPNGTYTDEEIMLAKKCAKYAVQYEFDYKLSID